MSMTPAPISAPVKRKVSFKKYYLKVDANFFVDFSLFGILDKSQ